MKNQDQVLRLINGVITEIFDPNIFYSRLSFLESGKDAIDIKTFLNQGKAYNGYKQPNIQNKFSGPSDLAVQTSRQKQLAQISQLIVHQ